MYDYTGFNFAQIENLDIFEYQAYLRDAFIYKCMGTQKGQEYLEKCWILEQTKPDRARLKEKFNRKGG